MTGNQMLVFEVEAYLEENFEFRRNVVNGKPNTLFISFPKCSGNMTGTCSLISHSDTDHTFPEIRNIINKALQKRGAVM